MNRRNLVLLLVVVCFAFPRSTAAEDSVTLWLGYSFGAASFETPSNSALAEETKGNEPLLALIGEVGLSRNVESTFILSMANFGYLVAAEDTAASTTPEDFAQVRRSVLADATIRWRIGGDSDRSLFATWNTGFVFDAQSDPSNVVQDASSYMFAGLSGKMAMGDTSKRYAQITLEALVGQSEIMTDQELFSKSWSDGRTVRYRPKLTFNLLDDRPNNATSLTPLSIGLWADLGTSSETGDTYVIFFSRPFWNTD
ncbi:MAG: hypothetical protein KC591_09285 [Gemmatimonadetes bacterium]|nr:hypothetical protein [Gemmatimonadota bacterium]